MAEIKVTPYDCIENIVKEALAKAAEQTEYNEIGFVGKIDLIQDVLRAVLQHADCALDFLDVDICDYDDMYQLTIDDEGFVTIVPVATDDGDYLIFMDDYLYVSDEMPLSYIRVLNDNKVKNTVFGFDYECDDDEDIEETAVAVDKMSDEEAQDLIDSEDWTLIYSAYNKMPDPFQQLVDFMLDWKF